MLVFSGCTNIPVGSKVLATKMIFLVPKRPKVQPLGCSPPTTKSKAKCPRQIVRPYPSRGDDAVNLSPPLEQTTNTDTFDKVMVGRCHTFNPLLVTPTLPTPTSVL
ncbi:hypothetical protein J6590_004271 [Homalodisca vitripennis]|nr:hypothetical protein J6590_004271 [Homalodisca vitripennis]